MKIGLRLMSAVVAMMALGFAALPGAVEAQTAEEEVMAVVRTLFDGMRERDEAKLRSVFHSTARLQSAGRADQVTPIDQFIGGIVSGSGPMLDEVTFDEQVIVDGALAMAWTPYNLFIGDRFSHCGVDAFTMVRTAEGWKIVQLVDTRTQEGCDPSRRG